MDLQPEVRENSGKGRGKKVVYHRGPTGLNIRWSAKEYQTVLEGSRRRVRLLCPRCEHRARFLEYAVARCSACEKGLTVSCEKYLPVKPLHIKKGRALRLPFCVLSEVEIKAGVLQFWLPMQE